MISFEVMLSHSDRESVYVCGDYSFSGDLNLLHSYIIGSSLWGQKTTSHNYKILGQYLCFEVSVNIRVRQIVVTFKVRVSLK